MNVDPVPNPDPQPGRDPALLPRDPPIPITDQHYQLPKERQEIAAELKGLLKQHPELRTPTLFINLDKIREQYELFTKTVPGVTPHYAVKCYSDERVVKLLDSLGCHFDAAGAGELRKLQSWGIDPKKVIVTKPVRKPEDLIAVADYQPRALVVKDPVDLDMLRAVQVPSKDYAPEILQRLVIPFSKLNRFGAEIAHATQDSKGETHWQVDKSRVRALFEHAQKIEAETGLKYGSFGTTVHIGTNNTDLRKVAATLDISLDIKRSMAACGIKLSIIDLGGGLPDKEEPKKSGTTQEQYIAEFGALITKYRAKDPDSVIINEPGRFMVADSGTVLLRVTRVDNRGAAFAPGGLVALGENLIVEVDDSLYLHFLGRWHEGERTETNTLKMKVFDFYPLRSDESETPLSKRTLKATLFGASCDSADVLGEPQLPRNLTAGDYLMIPNSGAYCGDTKAEKFNTLTEPQTCFYSTSSEGPKVHTLIDPSPINPDDYHRLLSTSANEDEIHFARAGGPSVMLNLSGIVGSLAGTKDSSLAELLRPNFGSDEATKDNKFPLFDMNKKALHLDNLHPEIKEGGMGWVLICNDTNLNRKVALKIGKVPADGELGERFRAEAEKTANFQHPHIPTIHSSGTLPKGNLPYYTMEFIEGKTLDKLLPDINSLSTNSNPNWRSGGLGAVINHLHDACRAVEYAHSKGVVHRDIKPDNIMLKKPDDQTTQGRKEAQRDVMIPSDLRGSIQVIDWGLFKARDGAEPLLTDTKLNTPGLTQVGAVVGTVDYMSPEQARGDDVTKTTDVWGLGATLYHAFCGHPPLFQHGDQNQRLTALKSTDPTGRNLIISPSKINQNIPRELESIIMKALRVDPNDRYESAAALGADLKNFLEKRPVMAERERLSTLSSVAYVARTSVEREWKKITVTAAGGMALWGGLLFQKQYEEGQREDAAAVVALNKLGETANEKLTSARAAIAKGNLDEAAALLSKDFIDQLNKEPTLADESFQFTEYRDDLLKFQKLETDFKEIASRQINTFDITAPISFDIPALKKAIEPYLPDGLTEAGIEKLRRDLDESTLTHEQRLVVGDKLIEALFLEILVAYPEHLRKEAPSSDLGYDEILRISKLLDQLGKACAGAAEDGRHGWIVPCELLNRTVYLVRADQESVAKTYARPGLNEGQRAMAYSLNGIFIESIDLNASFSSHTLGMYESARSLDPSDLRTELFLSHALHRLARQRSEDHPKRFLYNRSIESYQDARNLDRESPFIHGQLLLALHESWMLERRHPTEDRVTALSSVTGAEAGRRAVELCNVRGIEIPTNIWLAYGELAIVGAQKQLGIKCLENVLKIEPGNNKAIILLASAEAELRRNRFTEETLRKVLKDVRFDETISPLYLPEIAAIHTYLSQQAETLNDRETANYHKNSAFSCLEEGISKIPAYSTFIKRVEFRWFMHLKDDDRYQSLFN